MVDARILVGIGLDLVDLDHFSRHYADDEESLRRCFTEDEMAAVGTGIDRIPRLAGRFAAKEAAYKAIGGGTGLALTDIIIGAGPSGQPTVTLSGRARELATALGIGSFLVSLSHSAASAGAVVVALGRAD